MHLRKNGCQRRSISARDRGQAEWVLGLFFLLVLAILMNTMLTLAAWRSTAGYLEDALAMSNLASALIDLEEYGKSHRVVIADAPAAYDIYVDAVRDNLSLDDNWECASRTLIAGPVEIVDYIVYNVDQNRVKAIRIGRDGKISERWSGARGVVKAPNGVTVEYTGVYSEICFDVEGFAGVTVQAHKGKLVDVASEREEHREESKDKGGSET